MNGSKVLLTGSAGHLGEALARTLRQQNVTYIGLDIVQSPFTQVVGRITDRALLRQCMDGVDVILHTATLHKPHIATHSMQDFIETNITGTLALLETAVEAATAKSSKPPVVIFTSTTSVYGAALHPSPGTAAVWVTEELPPVPKNIYGVSKLAAENLCQIFHQKHGLPCLVLRTSRFFPEQDDDANTRNRYSDSNLKANEYLFRRVELADVVSAHLCAVERADKIGFGRYIISATSPFQPSDLAALNQTAAAVVTQYSPHYNTVYKRLGWSMLPTIGRVYVNQRARDALDWRPQTDFASILRCAANGTDPRSALAQQVGSKGYHAQVFTDGPYPVDSDSLLQSTQ